MNFKLIFTYLLLCTAMSALAQRNNTGNSRWKTIYPLEYCKEVPLQYIKNRNQYSVKIPKLGGSYYTETILKDLNDLSDLTEVLNTASKDYCPTDQVGLHFDFGNSVCTSEARKYTEAYNDLFGDITNIVRQDNRRTCENLVPFFLLQAEIANLTQEDFLSPRRTNNLSGKFFKLFADDEGDQLINHYYSCGGKDSSDQFIKNIILLSVKDACIAPKPIGSISWKDAEKIASEVAKDYKNMSILKIERVKSEIEKAAVQKYADKITFDTIDGILTPFLDGNKEQKIKDFVNNLDSYKKLKTSDAKSYSEYVSYVYSVDTAVEVGEKALPYLIKSSFSEKLPDSWTQDKKDEFIKNQLTTKAQENYRSCMSAEKEYISYSQPNLSDDEKIIQRVALREQYCQNHPTQCNTNLCGSGSLNMLSESREASDTQRVQGCVINSLTLGIKPLLKEIIKDQKEAFADTFALNDQMINSFTDEAWDTITSCINKKVKIDLNANEEVDILNNKKWLQKISTDSYQNHISVCASEAEDKVSKNFVDQVLLSNITLVQTFNQGQLHTDQFGNNVSQKLLAKVDEITLGSYNKCLSRQYELLSIENDFNEKNILLCSPIIEMKAASEVIEESLKEKNTENNPQINLKIKEFRACALEAIDNSISDIGNKNSTTSIITDQDAKQYLSRNNSLFNCVNKGISDLAYNVAGDEYDKIYEENKAKVTDKRYLKSLKGDVQETIQSCFSQKLTKLKDKPSGAWPEFMKFNEENGLDKLQDECTNLATSKVLSKLILKEARLTLKPLIATGFIKDELEISNILAQEAASLRRELNLSVQGVALNDRVQYSFEAAIREHLKNTNDSDSFLEKIQNNLESRTIANVHSSLNNSIGDSQFSSSFSKSCLMHIYKITSQNEQDQEDDSSLSLEQLSEYLKRGIAYYKKRESPSYTQSMAQLKRDCENIKNYTNEDQLTKSNFFEMIIKGQVLDSFATKLRNGIMQSAKDTIKEQKEPHKAIKLVYAKRMKTQTESLLDKYLSDKELGKLIFNDSKVVDFLTDNLDAVLNSEPETMDQVSQLLLNKLFSDTSNNSFADSFSKIQISGNFGISGITQTFEKASEGTSILWGLTNVGEDAGAKAAEVFFEKPSNIDSVIDWSSIPISKRSGISKSILHDAVLDSAKSRAIPKDMHRKVINILSNAGGPFGSSYAQGSLNLKIDRLANKFSNGYTDYDENVYKESAQLANEFLTEFPESSNSFSRKDLTNYLISRVKKVHMDINVTNVLLKHKYSGDKTIEDKITDKVSALGSRIWWRGAPD